MAGKLRDILEEKGSRVYSIEPSATVQAAATAMGSSKVGALLVTAGDEPVGILSERDITCRVVSAGKDPVATTVADVMTKDILVLKPDVAVEDAMVVATEKRIRHLPVVDGGAVVGMVTSGDLTRWIVRHREVEIRTLIDYISGKYPG